MFDVQDYAGGQRIQFSRSEFFLSDLKLIDDSGGEHALSDIELVDLTFNNASAAEAGVTFTFRGIPAETYDDLQFGLGVAPDLNTTTPSDHPSSSPLSSAGRYWQGWTSYIFSKTEGNIDTLVDGTDDLDLGFAYHSGTDALYNELRLNNGLTITEDGTTRVTFVIDHQTLMGLPANPIDIKANPQNHNPADFDEVEAIINNFLQAITYSIE
jgi:hypothetical protein